MTRVSRQVRTLAVLDVVVLLAGVLGVVSHGGEPGTPPEPAAERTVDSDMSVDVENGNSETPSQPTPTIEATPEGLSHAATATAMLPARFDMTLQFTHESWTDSEIPLRAASVTGIVDRDRLHYEMFGHDFVTATDDLYDYPIPPVALQSAEAAGVSGGPLTMTILGIDAYQCGLSHDGRCTAVYDWPTLVEDRRPSSQGVHANSAILAIPRTHLLSLTGVTAVEVVGPDEVQGEAVQHLRGMLTMSQALDRQAGDDLRDLRWWFSGILRSDDVVEVMGEEAFPFDVWIDGENRVRRLTVRILHDVRQFLERDDSAAVILEGPDAHVATITLSLHDIGATFDATPPTDTIVIPEPPPSVDPTFNGPIDAQKAAEEFEELIGSQ